MGLVNCSVTGLKSIIATLLFQLGTNQLTNPSRSQPGTKQLTNSDPWLKCPPTPRRLMIPTAGHKDQLARLLDHLEERWDWTGNDRLRPGSQSRILGGFMTLRTLPPKRIRKWMKMTCEDFGRGYQRPLRKNPLFWMRFPCAARHCTYFLYQYPRFHGRL